MKKLILVFAAVIMLAGGTVSVLQWLQIGPFAPKDKAAEAAKPPPPAGPPMFIDLDIMSIPLFQDDRLVTTVQIQLKVELQKSKEAEVQKNLPRITDAAIKELHGYLPRALAKNERIDLGVLKARVLAAIDKRIGAGIIDNVLVSSISDVSKPEDGAPKTGPYGLPAAGASRK